MKFNLNLHEGTDSIKFGMTSIQIQSILQHKPNLFKKTEVDILDTEEYEGIHVYYEEIDGKIVCSAFEFFEPSEVFLDNIQLVGEERIEIEDFFKNKFADCEVFPYQLASSKNEIFMSVKFNQTIQSIFIARQGYGEKQKAFYEKAFAKKL